MNKITQGRLQEIRNAFKVLGSISDEELEFFSQAIVCNKAKQQVVEKTIKLEMDTYEKVTIIIQKLNIPPNIDGYEYLRKAIIFFMEDKNPSKILITREVYPAIASEFEVTPSKVERGIRHAIEIAWSKKHDKNLYNQIFGDVSNLKKGKPSNSEFISYVAEYLKIH